MAHRRLKSFLIAAFACTLVGCGGGGGSSGASAGSPATTTTTTAGVPGAPTIGTVTAGDGSATVAFTAPASNGGAAITSYTATCTASGSLVATGASSPIMVTGLTNGVAYSCSVTASNSVGKSSASAAVSVTPIVASGTSTASVLCTNAGTYTGTFGAAGTLTSNWQWSCSATARSLTANGLPNHAVGTFPNPGNPNTIAVQTVNFSATVSPFKGTANRTLGGPAGILAVSLAGVKFDPGTAGSCPGSITTTADCNLANGNDVWRLEALGQKTFNFGVDGNNAHVQPGGAYHYHGIPEGLLANAGATDANRKMVLIGWAADGYPVYARYCYSNAMDASSPLKVCTGSYALDSAPDAGRPLVALAPLGSFVSDWNYVAGSGDLDDCNGRTGVTPEFPRGIYYYMATDTYPFFSRCLKGN